MALVGCITVAPLHRQTFTGTTRCRFCFSFTGALQIETEEGTRTADSVLVIGSNVSHRLSSPSPAAQLLYIEPTVVAKNRSRLNISGIDELSLSSATLDRLKIALDATPEQLDPHFGRNITYLLWPPEGAKTEETKTKETKTKETTEGSAFTPLDPRISKALSTIAVADNLNIKLETLALASGLSSSRFRHLFSEHMGMSVKRYLLWNKLQRAFQYLARSCSLTEAAHASGFTDSAHLSRTFKDMFGLTPVELNNNACFTTRKLES